MSDGKQVDGFYRCQVTPEQSAATISFAGRRIPVVLRESAIDGFTISIADRYAGRLVLGRQWMLRTGRQRNRVHAEWLFHSPGNDLQVGLRRLGEIEASVEPTGGWRTYIGNVRRSDYTNPAGLCFAALVVVIFLLASLLGVGDALGTAPRIQRLAETLLDGVGGWFR
jgi:hypothetical protein